MSIPQKDHQFPSRKQIHGSVARGGESSVPKTKLLENETGEAEFPTRVQRTSSHRKEASSWRIGFLVTAVIVLIFGVVGFGGQWLRSENLPPVLAVERIMDDVLISGRHGATPVITVVSQLQVNDVEVDRRIIGSGRIVEQGTPVLLSVSSFDSTGVNLGKDGRPILVVGEANSESIGSTLAGIVVGQTEGSRFVTARELESGETEINVVDILYTIAKGSLVDDQEGPLNVDVSDAGFSITPAQASPPEGLSIQVLLQGNGPQVASGDEVVAQYVAVSWNTGETVASTWNDGVLRLIELDTAMPGVREAVVDQRVGSRIAITIPPEMATGDGTLCVVVDILGTMPSIGTDS